MMRITATACLAGAALALAGCGRTETSTSVAEAAPDISGAESTGAAVATDVDGAVRPVPVSSPSGPAAAEGAPAFAVLYPGGQIDGPATTAVGASGPGGLVTYTTDADPDAVIAFHKSRAEAAGLSSVMAMNQGEARAYGAAGGQTGANVQVVAAPTPDGETSVQLSWSAGT